MLHMLRSYAGEFKNSLHEPCAVVDSIAGAAIDARADLFFVLRLREEDLLLARRRQYNLRSKLVHVFIFLSKM